MYEIYFSSSFERELLKIVKKNPKLKAKIRNQIKILADSPQSPRLGLHKLSGSNVWAISATDDLRILFSFQNHRIYCLKIGTHDEVY